MTNNPRILLVEDSEADVLLIQEAFEEAGLAPVFTICADGAAALDEVDRLASGGPQVDLILLDLNLPRVSGLEILDRIKTQSATQSLPVIVLSTSEAPGDVRAAYQQHANSYVTKPGTLDGYDRVIDTIGQYWTKTVKLPSRV